MKKTIKQPYVNTIQLLSLSACGCLMLDRLPQIQTMKFMTLKGQHPLKQERQESSYDHRWECFVMFKFVSNLCHKKIYG